MDNLHNFECAGFLRKQTSTYMYEHFVKSTLQAASTKWGSVIVLTTAHKSLGAPIHCFKIVQQHQLWVEIEKVAQLWVKFKNFIDFGKKKTIMLETAFSAKFHGNLGALLTCRAYVS